MGDLEAAARHLMVAVPLAARFGFHAAGSDALRICSRVEAAWGRDERRWRLVGAAMSLRGHCGLSLLATRSGEMWPPEPDPSQVAPKVVSGLIAEGEAMSPNETYEYALAGLSVLQSTS